MDNFPWQKKLIIVVWAIFLIACLSMVLLYPQQFKPQAIAGFVSQFKNTLLIVYFAISILRGLTLVPSTPFVLAGTILFPTFPLFVLAVSIIGIIFSSTMIYYFSDYLGFGNYLEAKHPDKISKIKLQLQKPRGFFFVFLWAFFPALPTDAVCYVAGTIRMDFKRFLLAITFGELILCSFYIFFGSYLLSN